jgi:imidazolonepropionase-like amidohydrolase
MRHLVALLFLFATAAFADPIVIRAQRVIDGRGHVLRNAAIVVDKGKIVAVEAHPKKVDIDLANATLMPGGIDTHVHIGWHFTREGRLHTEKDGESAAESAFAANSPRMTTVSFTSGSVTSIFVSSSICLTWS